MISTLTSPKEPAHGAPPAAGDGLVQPDELRAAFAMAMSQMYKNEVPLYGDLMRIVQGVNKKVLERSSDEPPSSDALDQLTMERHGAIRLGKASELGTVRRIFALLGMHPVGYYDLSAAGLPMHATCFRPPDSGSLRRNPFRVFTTLLRTDLIRSEEARRLALQLLSKRNLFSEELMQLLDRAEAQNGIPIDEADVFIREAMQIFRWAPVAASTLAEYRTLREQHPILADIACFRTAHINHLTPRTLDIGLTQAAMLDEGMAVKDRIEGPPPRKCQILLRQTSFLALEEAIRFKSDEATDQDAAAANNLISASHKARFGEIEERGAAVTPAGRRLYDELLEEAFASSAGKSIPEIDAAMAKAFVRYPDQWDELCARGLVYYEYRLGSKRPGADDLVPLGHVPEADVERLVGQGFLERVPITYEDFLPFSAAGIFQSNLPQDGKSEPVEKEVIKASPDHTGMERALGSATINPDGLYEEVQRKSLASSLAALQSIVQGAGPN
ncbi:hypothetical protein MCOR31_010099 [Pyricularia oryzae]|nr:hypothetical protein MCOR26_011399 [Pyricularia oryzae]KAI6331724.1 hypothetical protein MCOR28_011219 [Pyricularia oryzae]KAI6357924.1 hypothetical protein MCOR31_010099 [Pyricularia oryzae]KAI6368743.1 hypothetical protein MCOR32_006813 [Pyricularia oryzae]KAI6387926.1 hypothetical protein MCOR23_010934 [Pyricularia oryzae]